MPLFLSRDRLDANDQAASAARTQELTDDVTRQYAEAQAPESPSYALPPLSQLGVSDAGSPVMSAIASMPQIGRQVVREVVEPALSWALPSLESLGVSPKPPKVDLGAEPGGMTLPGPDLGRASFGPGADPGLTSGGSFAAMPTGAPAGTPAPQAGGFSDVTPSEEVTRESVTRSAAAALTKAGLPAGMAPYLAGIAINEGILQPGTIARDYWSVGGVKADGGSGTITVPTREVINGQSVMQQGTFGRFNSMQEGMDALARFVKESPRFGPIVQRAAQSGDFGNLIVGFKEQGYATDPNWVGQVNSIASGLPVPAMRPQPTTPTPAEQTPAAQQQAFSAGSYTPNQIAAATSEGLDYETALAVCGPAAAIAFARKNGRNPTMQEALALAKQAGWTVEQGMAGPGSQQRLLQSMGVASRLVDGAPDWQAVAADVQRGNPVILSTPGHYFVAERYNPEDGTFDFGESAAVLKASGGRRWFRPEELPSLGMGEARASLFMDSPQSPSPSVVAGRSQTAGVPPAPAAPPSAPAAQVPTQPAAAGATSQIGQAATAGDPLAMKIAEPMPEDASDSERYADSLNTTLPQLGPPMRNEVPFDPETGQAGWPGMQKAPLDGGTPVRDTWASEPTEQPYDPDQGPREATPGSVGAQPAVYDPRVQDEAPGARELPVQQVAVEQAPTGGMDDPGTQQAAPAPWPEIYYPGSPIIRQGQRARAAQEEARAAEPTPAPSLTGDVLPAVAASQPAAVQKGVDAAIKAYNDPVWASVPAPARAVKIIQDTGNAYGDEVGRAVGRALGLSDEDTMSLLGIPFSQQDVAGTIGSMVTDPTNYVGATLADPVMTVAKGAIRDFVPDVVRGVVRRAGPAISAAGELLEQGRATARAAEAAPGTSTFGTFGFSPAELEMRNLTRTRVVPPEVADTLDFPIRIPDDPAVIRAIEAAGGTVDPEKGVTMNVIRYQGPEAHGRTATRGAPFYTAGRPGEASPYATGSNNPLSVGGTERIEGLTRFRSPLILSDAPGGGGFDEAMGQLNVRGSAPESLIRELENDLATAENMARLYPRSDSQMLIDNARYALEEARAGQPVTSMLIDDAVRAARRAGPEGSPARAQALKDLVSRYGGDPNLIDDLLAIRGADASESAWAIKENILAGNARRQGYDGVVTVQPDVGPAYSNALEQAVQAHPQYQAQKAIVDDLTAQSGHLEAEYGRAWEQYGYDAPETQALRNQQDALNRQVRAAERKLDNIHDRLIDEIEFTPPTKITELMDPREARNPTPGAPLAESLTDLNGKVQAARDRWRELAARGVDSPELAATTDEVKRLEDAWSRALSEGTFTGPPGYALREDIPRRPTEPPRSVSLNAGFGALPGESRRFYHGTAGAFERPDPGKFDPNGLFGPGYYLTSDPRVAGSYSGARAFSQADVEQAAEALPRVRAIRDALLRNGPDDPRLPDAERRLAVLEQQLASGPNVRAVDVPSGLRVLDLDTPIRETPGILDTIEQALGDPAAVERFRNAMRDQATRGKGVMTGEDIYRGLEQSFGSTYDRLPRPQPSPSYAAGPFLTAKESANAILRQAGYDGVAHTGGKRVPMLDDAGNPIEHDVTIIFPESLDKITNAFSGEVGGAGLGALPPGGPRGSGLLPAFNRAASEAIVGGTGGAVIEQARNPDEDPRTAAGRGFLLGAAGFPLATRVARRAARAAGANTEARGALSTLGHLPDEAPRYRPELAREPVLPGMEPPPRVREPLPDISDERNVGSRPGMNAGAPTEMLPGFERIDPLTDPVRPGESGVRVPEQSIRDALPSLIRSLQPKREPKLLADAAERAPALPGMETPPSVLRRVRTATQPWVDRVNILRYAGMLADTASQSLNVASNTLLAAKDVAVTPIAAAIDVGRVAGARAIGRQADRQVFFSEVGARLTGQRTGARVGLQPALEILRSGLSAEDAAKVADQGAEVGFRSGNAVVDFAAELPLRALAAADAVFRSSAAGGHLMAEATAAATRANGGRTPTAEMIREAAKNPDLLERVQKLAARSVLQEDRAVTRAYQQFVRDLGPAGLPVQVEVPFVRTPYNVIAQGVGMTPAGLAGLIQDVKAGRSAREVEYRLAHVALGTAIMAGAAGSYANGELTGPYPTDAKERSTLPPGWRPWSRKVTNPVNGETYYLPLSVLGPLALPAVTMILAGEAEKKGKTRLSPEWAGAVALGVGRYAAQNSFFEGVSNIARTLDERQGSSALEQQVEQIAAQFSPHILGGGALGREIQRVMGMPARDPEGALEALLATHPLTAGRVEPRQDALGRPASLGLGGPAGAVVRAGVEKDAGVIAAFREAGEGLPTAAPRSIRNPAVGGTQTLSPTERHRWRAAFGEALENGWMSIGMSSDPARLRRIEAEAREHANDVVLGVR